MVTQNRWQYYNRWQQYNRWLRRIDGNTTIDGNKYNRWHRRIDGNTTIDGNSTIDGIVEQMAILQQMAAQNR